MQRFPRFQAVESSGAKLFMTTITMACVTITHQITSMELPTLTCGYFHAILPNRWHITRRLRMEFIDSLTSLQENITLSPNLQWVMNSAPMEELTALVKAQLVQRMGGQFALNYKRERRPWTGVLGCINRLIDPAFNHQQRILLHQFIQIVHRWYHQLHRVDPTVLRIIQV